MMSIMPRYPGQTDLLHYIAQMLVPFCSDDVPLSKQLKRFEHKVINAPWDFLQYFHKGEYIHADLSPEHDIGGAGHYFAKKKEAAEATRAAFRAAFGGQLGEYDEEKSKKVVQDVLASSVNTVVKVYPWQIAQTERFLLAWRNEAVERQTAFSRVP